MRVRPCFHRGQAPPPAWLSSLRCMASSVMMATCVPSLLVLLLVLVACAHRTGALRVPWALHHDVPSALHRVHRNTLVVQMHSVQV